MPGFHHSVAVLFRCHFAVPVSRYRFRTPLPLRSIPMEFHGDQFPCARDMDIEFFYITTKKLTTNEHISLCLGSLASMIGWPATERRKNRTRSYFNGRTVTTAFCRLRNGIFLRNFYRTTEFYNSRMAKRQQKNGNGMMETGHQSAQARRLQTYIIGLLLRVRGFPIKRPGYGRNNYSR